MARNSEVVDVAGHDVTVTNPEKVFFPESGITKLELVRYYLSVMPGVLTGSRRRPTLLFRWPNGVDAEPFYQKRVPQHRPEWLQTTTIHFPSGRSAEMLVVADAAHVVWAINLGCIDLNPWPVRAVAPSAVGVPEGEPAGDLDHPDELRVDLDPTSGIDYGDVRAVALIARDVLNEHGLEGWPKTSGKRGMHIYVRIEPRWSFTLVRRAALAFAREVERRAGGMATTAWWKEERAGVFVDYNQNARDRTIASAYSVRPVPDARVSCPLAWDEVAGVEPQTLNLKTVPARFKEVGDPGAGIDEAAGVLDSLLGLADKDEHEGLGDAPWPPHFPKGDREPVRAAPSRRRSSRPRGNP